MNNNTIRVTSDAKIKLIETLMSKEGIDANRKTLEDLQAFFSTHFTKPDIEKIRKQAWN